jgi:hypothetical protein
VWFKESAAACVPNPARSEMVADGYRDASEAPTARSVRLAQA